MLGLSNSSSMLYLCIYICVFVHETLKLGNINFDIPGPWAFRKCMVCMYVMYGLKHHTVEISGDVTDTGRTTNNWTREDRATQPLDAGRLSFAIYSAHKLKSIAFSVSVSTSLFKNSGIREWGDGNAIKSTPNQIFLLRQSHANISTCSISSSWFSQTKIEIHFRNIIKIPIKPIRILPLW